MRMSKQHFDFIADSVGPIVGWPSALHELADKLSESNARFDKEKFLKRATDAWAKANEHKVETELNDEIRF